MAFQAVPDTASVTLMFNGVPAGEVAGCEAEFTLYVRDEVVAWDAGQLDQLNTYVNVWFDTGKNGGTGLDTVIDDGWVLTQIVARDLSQEFGLSRTLVSGLTGQRSGSVVPPSLALLVRFQGDAGSPPKSGWVFVPAGTEPDLEGSQWASALVTATAQKFTDFLTDLNDAGAGGDVNWAQVIVSRSASTNDNVQEARAALRAAIAATRRATALTNTLSGISGRREIASQRDRRPSS